MFKRKPKANPDAMTLYEHLAELRRRLTISAIGFLIMATVVFALYSPILSILEHPLCSVEKSCKLIALGPLDLLGIRVKIAGYGGLVFASPIWAWQLWKFITPGLKSNEKKYVIPFSLSAFALFFLGGLIAYFTYPHALAFFKSVGGSSIRPNYTADNYFNLLLALMVIFGLTFEFPVILVGLQLAGAVKPQQLAKHRRIVMLGLLILSAVITPSSDPFSMFAMFIPLVIFYEISIILGKLIYRSKARAERV
jgi:sec-independent protein translocase protein TatC